jgi:hypothetical protein
LTESLDVGGLVFVARFGEGEAVKWNASSMNSGDLLEDCTRTQSDLSDDESVARVCNRQFIPAE